MKDILGPELERLCGLQNIDFGRDKAGNFILHKDGGTTTIGWRMVLSQHKSIVHTHHEDDCYFVSESYYNLDRQMSPDCNCPRTVTPANPLALAKSIVDAILEKTHSFDKTANEVDE